MKATGNNDMRSGDQSEGLVNNKPRWINDCIFLPHFNKIIVASDDHLITFCGMS